MLLTTDAVKIFFAANKDAAVGNRRRSINRFANRIRAEDLVLRTRLDDERIAVFAGHQNLSFKSNRRGGERCGNRNASAFVFHFASLRIDASEDAAVGSQVEIVAVENW